MSNADLGQVFTRRILADYMVSLLTLPTGSTVLDPCFGNGVFLDSIVANTDYLACGYEIDRELYNNYLKKTTNINVYNIDFLLSEISAQFDGIVMNPPYIRHEKIDALASYGITKAHLMERPCFSQLPKTANLYMYFVIKAISLLRYRGELIVIFPESWINSKGGIVFRNLILSNCCIEKRIHVNGRGFEKNALVAVIILKLKKAKLLFDCEPQYISVGENKINISHVEKFQPSLQSRVSFSTYATIRRGLTTGCNKIFVNPALPSDKCELIDIISSPKSVKGFSTRNALTDKLLLVKNDTFMSKELKLYLKDWERAIKKTKSPKTLAEKIKNGERWYSLKILSYGDIIFGYMVRNDMRFILNESGVIARDNFYLINAHIDKYTMLALLNNYYIYTQLEANGRKYGGGMLKLQKYDVETLMLTNLSIISQDDNDWLAKLGHRLSCSGDRAIIDEITALLSTYESIDMNEIKAQYEYTRAKRLENGK